jgi:phosphohistidine phosphatase
MANRLKVKNICPDLILTSPANRALHTAVIFARVLEYPMEKLAVIQEIYGGSENSVLSHIKKTDDQLHSVMIFGHNPDFTYLANTLCETCIDNLPTAGVVGIEFNIDTWKNADKTYRSSEFFDYPKKE